MEKFDTQRSSGLSQVSGASFLGGLETGYGQCFIKTSMPETLLSGCVSNGSSISALKDLGNATFQSHSKSDWEVLRLSEGYSAPLD